jgi:uncharacterized repeat protein (TIGR03987 family)
VRSLEWLFVVALILYSTAIWSDRLSGSLKKWMIACFGVGLLADVSGTVLLCAPATIAWHFTLHTVTGLLSLLIMALHFVWAVLASKNPTRFGALFHRWSVAAWSLWMVSFLSGAFIH